MNWGQIKADFKALLDRDDATDDQIEAWCRDGYLRVGRVVRLPAQDTIVELTVTKGGYLLIPQDYMKLRHLWTPEGGKLRKTTFDNILQWAPRAGPPKYYTRVANRWYIYPNPGEGSKVQCVYSRELTPITSDNTVDPLFLSAAPLIIRAALVFAEDFYDGSRQAKWEAQYQQILAELQEQVIDADEGSADAAVEPGYADLEY